MVKNFNYNNKLILVTGGTTGIGFELVKILCTKCRYLAIVGRDEKKLSTEFKNLLKKNKNIIFYSYDFKKLNGIPVLINKIKSKFNMSIDVVFNCAGYAVLGKIDKIPMNEYINNFNVNYFSSVYITKELISEFKSKKSGQFIFISSGVGKRGLPGVSSYCSTKSALNSFCESLRIELLKYNIDVIIVSPGLVESNFKKNTSIFGTLKNYFDDGRAKSPKNVANKIFNQSIKRKKNINLSFKTIIGTFISNNFPGLIEYYLSKKF